MDDFFKLLNAVVEAQGGDSSQWSESYQEAVEALRASCYAYAQRRFDSGYDMGWRHARDKYNKLVLKEKRKEVDCPTTQVILTCKDLY